MGNQQPTSGRPTPTRRTGAADLCREFMETFGWADLFKIAKGQEVKAYVKTAFGTKQVVISPDFNARLTAYRLVASYGYGRPCGLARPDEEGRAESVTDALLGALVGRAGAGLPAKGAE